MLISFKPLTDEETEVGPEKGSNLSDATAQVSNGRDASCLLIRYHFLRRPHMSYCSGSVHGDGREKRDRWLGVGLGGKVDKEVWMAPHCREWERLLVLRSLVLSEGWLAVMGG